MIFLVELILIKHFLKKDKQIKNSQQKWNKEKIKKLYKQKTSIKQYYYNSFNQYIITIKDKI